MTSASSSYGKFCPVNHQLLNWLKALKLNIAARKKSLKTSRASCNVSWRYTKAELIYSYDFFLKRNSRRTTAAIFISEAILVGIASYPGFIYFTAFKCPRTFVVALATRSIDFANSWVVHVRWCWSRFNSWIRRSIFATFQKFLLPFFAGFGLTSLCSRMTNHF